MTILAPLTDPIAVTGGAPGVVYRLERPSVVRRLRYREEVARQGGRQWTIGSLLAGLDAAADALLADDPAGLAAVKLLVGHQRDRLQEYLDEVRSRGEGWSWSDEAGERLLEVLRWPDALEAFAARVAMGHPRYADMVADNAVYGAIRGVAAARLALLAIEGAGVPVVRRDGVVAEETLAAIPEGDLLRIGEAYDAACSLSPAQKKASPSPSGGVSGPVSSTAASTAPASDPGPTTPGSSTSSAGTA